MTTQISPSKLMIGVVGIHPDDRGQVQYGQQIDVMSFAGRRIRVSIKVACKLYSAGNQIVVEMARLGLLTILRVDGRDNAAWVVLDPGETRFDLYERWIANAPAPRTHRDFDRYQKVRSACEVAPTHPTPSAFALVAAMRLLELGTSHAAEAGAFIPLPKDDKHHVVAQVMAAARGIALKAGIAPTLGMVLETFPALKDAPGTSLEPVLGADMPPPEPRALARAWGMGPVRGPACLFAYVGPGTVRRPFLAYHYQLQISRFDRHFAQMHPGKSIRNSEAVAATLEHIAFSEELTEYAPAVRLAICELLMTFTRRLRLYAAAADPDGSLGLAALVPAQHPDRLAFCRRLTEAFGHLRTEGQARRKARSSRAAERLAQLCEIVTFRMEQVRATENAANLAAEALKMQEMAVSAEATANYEAALTNGQAPSEEDAAAAAAAALARRRRPFVEFIVDTVVIEPHGRILDRAQKCIYRAWRERDFWLKIKGKRKPSRKLNTTMFARCREIEADPNAYGDVVFEYRGCRADDGGPAITPWFVNMSNLGAWVSPGSMSPWLQRRRHNLIRTWGLPAYAGSATGLLGYGTLQSTLWRIAAEQHLHIVPIQQFALAMRFADLAFNAVIETLCRMSEFMQMEQNKLAWRKTEILGEAALSFMAIPKTAQGAKPKAVPFEVTQITFVEAMTLAGEVGRIDGDPNGWLAEIPAVDLIIWKQPKPRAWVFQFNGRALTHADLQRFLSFLLGNVMQVTYHDLRHSAAQSLSEEGMAESTLQYMLNHSTLFQTRYYSGGWNRRKALLDADAIKRARVRGAHRRAANAERGPRAKSVNAR